MIFNLFKVYSTFVSNISEVITKQQNQMDLKSYLLVVLFIPVLAISGCKSKNETKKAPITPSSEEAEAIVKPASDISIHQAALDGQSAEVMRILSEGSDINTKDQEGRTALMYAAFNGHTGIMEKLLGKGASINLSDNFGRTALMFASSGPYPSAVKLLLANQADPNIADSEEHFTALMFAAAEGQIEAVRLLLASKADPSLKDIDGDNALSFAQKNGHQEVVNLLLPYTK